VTVKNLVVPFSAALGSDQVIKCVSLEQNFAGSVVFHLRQRDRFATPAPAVWRKAMRQDVPLGKNEVRQIAALFASTTG
jgi:hypothetical protein